MSKNFFWSIVGTFLYALGQWLILTILAKSLHVEFIGMYSLALGVSTPIAMMCWLSLRALLATDKNQTYTFKEYFQVRILFSSIGLVVTLIAGLFFPYSSETKLILVFLGFSKFFEGISDIVYGYFQSIGNTYIMGMSLTIRSIFSMLLFLGGLSVFSNTAYAFISLPIASLTILLLYDLPKINVANLIKYKAESQKLFQLIKLSFPLGIYPFLFNVFIFVPRFFLEKYDGVASVGFYSGIYVLVMTGVVFANAISDVIMPKMAVEFSNNRLRSLFKMAGLCILIAFLLTLVGIIGSSFWGANLLSIIYSKQYVEYSYLLIPALMMMFLELTNKFLINILTVFRILKPQSWVYAFNLILIIPICIYCVQQYGIKGAFIAQSIVNLIQLAIVVTIIYRFQKKWNNQHMPNTSTQTN